MENGKRILRIQNELITYERFTANAPFQFKGCQRGAIGTQAGPHEGSSRVGLLDMYTAGLVRLSQNTNIEAEVAKPLQEIYKQAGLKFIHGFSRTKDYIRRAGAEAPLWRRLVQVAFQLAYSHTRERV